MIEPPILETPRLRLRPLESSDTAAIQRTAANREIADTMISLPHPYPADEAERYFARQQAEREAGRAVTFAIEHKAERSLCGLIELRDIDREHLLGELSFWLALEAWGKGYMSEVVPAVVDGRDKLSQKWSFKTEPPGKGTELSGMYVNFNLELNRSMV